MSIIRKALISPQLFGRTQELGIIRDAILSVLESRGQCLLVSGDAGIGKSRLSAAARETAGNEGFNLLYGVCFEQDMALPYGPWIYAIREYLSKKSPIEMSEVLGEFAPEISRVIPEIVGSSETHKIPTDLSPEAEKWRLFEALLRFLSSLTRQQPLMIVLEDLHWGDETSLELLQLCARRLSQSPILFIGTYRSESMTPQLKRFLLHMNRERLATQIQLSALTRHNIAEMIRAIFGIERPIKLDFLDLIVQLTGGNPFFVEEVLKSLVESGGIYYSNGVWERRPVVELQVPASTLDAVQERLLALSPDAQNLVTLMAVAGRNSTFELLQVMTGTAESQLIQRLKELIEAQLVVEASQDQFAFRHELTREAVYAGLMQRERHALHRMIAEKMEEIFADNLETYQANLAMHYSKSGQWEKALEYARRAGEKALALHSPREAVEQFNQAILASNHLLLPPDIQLHRARGLANQLLGNYEQAHHDFETCLEIARSSLNKGAEWQALLDLAFLMEGRDYPRAGEYNQEALAVARQLGDPVSIGRCLIRLTIWYTNMNQAQEGSACVREALQLFESIPDDHGLALALSAQGNIHISSGYFRQGSECYIRAIPLFKKAGDLQGQFDCLINLSLVGGMDLYYTEPPMISISRSRRYAEAALEIARQMNSQSDEAIATIRLAMILRTQGRYAQAIDLSQSATELAEGLDHAEWISFGLAAQAEIQRDLLEIENARKFYERSLEQVERSGNLEIMQSVVANLARACLDLGQIDRAKELLDQARKKEGSTNTMSDSLIQYGYARLEMESGCPEKTLLIIDGLLAAGLERSGQEDLQAPHLNYMRGDALRRLGRVEEARQELHKARDNAGQLGGLPLLWRIHLSLARLEHTQNQQAAQHETDQAKDIITRLAEALPDHTQRKNFIERAFAYFAPYQTPEDSGETSAAEGPLSAREMEVVTLIKAGKSNQEIADVLVLSKRTVEKHISNILSKLMLTTRAQLIVWGLSHDQYPIKHSDE
jgi:predicted ATPase/DNA-binding CsgD family transcriptional regulator